MGGASMAQGQLIYDADCRLCAASARWAAHRAQGALELVPFGDARVPAAIDADRTQAHYIEGDTVRHGGAAVTRALQHTRARRLADVLDRAPLSSLRDRGYRLVAVGHASVFRHRLTR